MKDLATFLAEKKKEERNRPLRKDEGEDDQLYIDLMGYYKHVARKSKHIDEANKYLDTAMKLAREGDVSDKAKTAAQYI